MNRKTQRPVSIRTYLSRKLLFFIVPIILSLVISNMLAIHTVTERVTELNYNMLSLYMENMEERLADVDLKLYNLLVLDDSVSALEHSPSRDRLALNVSALARRLSENLAAYSTIEGIFVYNRRWDVSVNAKNTAAYFLDQQQMKEMLREAQDAVDYGESRYTRRQWYPVRVGGVELLLCDVSDQEIRTGAYVSVDAWMRQLEERTQGQFDCLYLEDASGQAWGAQPPENPSKYLAIRVPNQSGSYTLVGLVRRDTLLLELTGWQGVVLFAAVLMALLLLSFVLRYLRRAVAEPVQEFTAGMQRVRDGDLSVRLEPRGRFLEFRVMGECFNEMVAQIQHLKISVYEEQLKKQKAELRFLQLQSGPHYYLNSLNVLYSLALKPDIPLLKKMILILSRQSRYMLKSADTLVSLDDELAHVADYVLVQKERLPYPVEYTQQHDPSLGETLIPPLLLHTFVENSFKYGVSGDRVLRIWITVTSAPCAEGQRLRLVVEDAGGGFPPERLETLRRGETVIDELGNEHYGIENIRQRLELIYGRRAELELSNRPEGGAKMEALIPVEPRKERPYEADDRG